MFMTKPFSGAAERGLYFVEDKQNIVFVGPLPVTLRLLDLMPLNGHPSLIWIITVLGGFFGSHFGASDASQAGNSVGISAFHARGASNANTSTAAARSNQIAKVDFLPMPALSHRRGPRATTKPGSTA